MSIKELEWKEKKCPICSVEIKYLKNGYIPLTCDNFHCIYEFQHKKAIEQAIKRNEK